MANNIGYIVAPMGLTERQILIYQKLYEKCNFSDMTVKYTMEQIALDIKSIEITKKVVINELKKFMDKGYLKLLRKGTKNNPNIFQIIKINEIIGNELVTEKERIGNEKPSNSKGLSRKKVTNGEQIGGELVTPIKEKEKENDNNIYSYWNSKKIIVHKSINKDIERAIEKVLKKYSEDEIVQAIDNYSEILESDFYFNYKWSLVDFLNRKNGISSFMEEGSNKANYESWKRERENNANTNRFTKRDRGVFNKDSENIKIELPNREHRHYTNEELAALGID